MLRRQPPRQGHFLLATPTVASGTVISVNATPVASHNSPEWSGPNKHSHGRFRLFFTLFSGHDERSPDPEAAFKHYQIRNESQANSESHLSSRNCLQRQTRTEEFREKQEREREGKEQHLIYMIFEMIAHPNLIICSLYSAHLHIARSWLWLKQNLLVSVDTDISQCLPPVSLSTLHTSS